MKKFFAILAIASVMVACNNGAEGEKKAEDTAAKSETNAANATADTATKAATDTMPKADTAAKK